MKTLCATAFVLLAASGSTSAVAAPAPPLVTFEQTGGFAGIERGMTVRRSGVVVSDGLPVTISRLSPTRLATLKQRLVAARWSTLKARYLATSPVSDGFVYRLTYAGRTIRVDQGAALPLRLARVKAMLDRIAGLSS